MALRYLFFEKFLQSGGCGGVTFYPFCHPRKWAKGWLKWSGRHFRGRRIFVWFWI